MKVHLCSEDLKLIKDILKHHLPNHHVLIFGSRVAAHHKPHSDVDLCILGDEPLSLKQTALLREAFSESDLPMRVDIVDWATLTSEFKNIIKKNSMQVC